MSTEPETAGAPVSDGGSRPAPDGGSRPASDELVIAFTPRQILGGFVLVAAFVLLVLRRRRSKG